MHPFCEKIFKNKEQTNTLLCVGLDPDLSKIPQKYPQTIEGVYLFLDAVIQATLPYCVAYKPNISFFEALGIDGLICLERVCKRIPKTHPVIIDGKRGDIGNTSAMQAKFMFDFFGAEATTLHPYMGEDSLVPFFSYKEKFHFVLALTSNPGAATFEKQILADGKPLYEKVLAQLSSWHSTYKNVGAVVGATQSELSVLRALEPNLLFLIPGVGAQGARYDACFPAALNEEGLALINVGRSLLYDVNHNNLDADMKKAVEQLTTQRL